MHEPSHTEEAFERWARYLGWDRDPTVVTASMASTQILSRYIALSHELGSGNRRRFSHQTSPTDWIRVCRAIAALTAEAQIIIQRNGTWVYFFSRFETEENGIYGRSGKNGMKKKNEVEEMSSEPTFTFRKKESTLVSNKEINWKVNKCKSEDISMFSVFCRRVEHLSWSLHVINAEECVCVAKRVCSGRGRETQLLSSEFEQKLA